MLPAVDFHAERVVWSVFGLALFLCSHSMAQGNATDEILVYSVTEESPNGTVVGNLALGADLYRAVDLTQTTFTILSNGNIPDAANIFTIESSTGVLKTKTVIDRDVICAQQSVCQSLFSVTVRSNTYFRVIKVLVNINDINDCAPTFTPSRLNLTVSESAAVGELIPLPVATDLDSPPNGVESYVLQPDQDPFRLQVRNISSLLDVRLNLTSMLDREQQSSYTLALVAYDGGLPPRSGSLVLEITVADVNDNSPVFDNSSYEVHVPENTSVGSMIAAVHASDRDAGPNGRIKYKFSQRSQTLYGMKFFLEPDSGNVILLQTLNAAEESSYSLAVLAVDQGVVPLSGSAALLIVVEQVNDRPPVINVDALSDDGLATIPETSPVGTFVAHVSVVAQGGQTVSCTLNDTDNFQLVPLSVRNEFKVVTIRAFNAAQRNSYVVVISCTEDGEPHLSSADTLAVFIAAGPGLDPPVFVNPTYNATVIVSAPPGIVVVTVRALVPSTAIRNVTIAYAINTTDANKGFYVDPQSGVVATLVSFGKELAGTDLVFTVIAFYRETNNTAGQSSRATVRVRLLDNGAKPPRFQQNYYSFSVLETADVGTAIGSVMATVPIPDNVSYYAVPLPGTQIVDLAVDENSGVIYSVRALVRDLNPSYGFQVVARNRRSVELYDSARVDVYVQENRPNITYPGPGYNNTVYITPTSGLQTLIATAAARLSQPGDLTLCFSIRNYSEFFSIDARSGQLRLTSNISQYSNHTLTLVIEVAVCGHPFARSSAALYITVVGEMGMAPQRSPAASGGFDSRVVILACVLSVCFVLATVMVVAIVLVCARLRRKRNSRTTSSGATTLWTIQAGASPERSFSRDGQHRMTDVTLQIPPDPFKAIELEEADADSGCPSNSSSSQTSSDDGAGGTGAAGGGTSRSGVPGGGGGDDSKRSSNSSDNNDGGSSVSPVFVTPASSHLYSVPNWLRTSSSALPLPHHAEPPAPVHSLDGASTLPDKPLVLKPILSRSGSLASRKSIRFGPDGSAIAEAKKNVHFAEQNQYLELNTSDVIASDVTDLSDVGDSRGSGADDQDDVSDASSCADSETRRTVINTMANSGYSNVPHYPPPGVSFGTFLPEDGSLV